MAYVKKRSVLPVYFIGGTWLLWSLFAPLYRPAHYIMAALASFIAYNLGKMLFPDRGYEMQDTAQAAPAAAPQPQPAPKREEKPKSTGNPEIDALLLERDRAVSEMRRLNDSIEDPQISAQITHLETTTGKIIDAVAASPSKLPKIRKFMNYYLPTTLKILRAYAQLDAQGIEGENISAAKKRIEDMMDQVVSGFEKQLDKLFQDDAMDITSDVEVLENMLKKDGLSDEGGITMTL